LVSGVVWGFSESFDLDCMRAHPFALPPPSLALEILKE
jgi:hypothetical protein